jgi:hypothetical protein
MADIFSRVEGASALALSKGVYSSCAVYSFGGQVFIAYGTRYLALRELTDSCFRTSVEHVIVKELLYGPAKCVSEQRNPFKETKVNGATFQFVSEQD